MKVVLTFVEILIWREIKKAFPLNNFFYIFTRGKILAIEADVLYRPHLDENIFAPVLQLFLRGAAFLSIINILACVHRLSWQIHYYKYTSTAVLLSMITGRPGPKDLRKYIYFSQLEQPA